MRRQLLVTIAAAVLLPLGLLLLAVDHQASTRLTEEYRDRIETLIAAAEVRLAQESGRLVDAVERAAEDLRATSGLHRFLQGDSAWASALPAVGTRSADRADLDLLQLRDEAGSLIFGPPGPLLGRPSADPLFAESPDGILLVVAREVDLSDRTLLLVGGRRAEGDFLNSMAPDSSMAVGLVVDGRLKAGSSLSGLARDLSVPFLGDGAENPEPASLRIAHALGRLEAVLSALRRWLLLAFAGVSVAGLAGAWWAASRFTRPMEQLVHAFESTQLDAPSGSPRFLAHRRDEVGRLSRTFDAMLRRLRRSANGLRSAERRAAIGDFARQANHDIKNGLAPVRNVVAHLDEVSDDPQTLQRIFRERQGTLSSGMEYLQRLASVYACLSEPQSRAVLDVCDEVRKTVSALAAADPRVTFSCRGKTRVVGDALALRRIVENLVSNALDSLEGDSGSVRVSVYPEETWVRIEVVDSGRGIPASELDRLFDDFYTTKRSGSGLGLSIVRRLTADLGGSVGVESVPGQGSSFAVRLPEHTDSP